MAIDRDSYKQDGIELCIGPMSDIVVDAVFDAADSFDVPLTLIASKNQIDYDGGYVEGWTTSEFMKYINQIRKGWGKDAKVKIARDHCGPGFKKDSDTASLEDTRNTIFEDIVCGFDQIHIDLCHYQGDNEEKVARTIELIKFARSLTERPLQIEVGTEENIGRAEYSPTVIDNIDKLAPHGINYYVIQTGSLVEEGMQIGNFHPKVIMSYKDYLSKRQIKLKEHNADFLNAESIRARLGFVDAMNIAPQFGILQTMTMLAEADKYGFDSSNFKEACYASGKWKKWMSNPVNYIDQDWYLWDMAARICGHYNFETPQYKELEKATDESCYGEVLNNVIQLIGHYYENTRYER